MITITLSNKFNEYSLSLLTFLTREIIPIVFIQLRCTSPIQYGNKVIIEDNTAYKHNTKHFGFLLFLKNQ
ncbi:hypothetical protein CYANOKiyG1_01570 [Okeania sp. KiyG1]|nr:hypothetical protein CYANOKiyG1_01570 [Okeania sp. KiyG1]